MAAAGCEGGSTARPGPVRRETTIVNIEQLSQQPVAAPGPGPRQTSHHQHLSSEQRREPVTIPGTQGSSGHFWGPGDMGSRLGGSRVTVSLDYNEGWCEV